MHENVSGQPLTMCALHIGLHPTPFSSFKQTHAGHHLKHEAPQLALPLLAHMFLLVPAAPTVTVDSELSPSCWCVMTCQCNRSALLGERETKP